MRAIYYNDDQYHDLDDLRIAITDACELPDMGDYIDEDGRVTITPPMDECIIIKSLSALLIDRVPGYQ